MKTEKPFDAVKTMRKIRDRLSRRFKDMSFEEQKAFLLKQLGGPGEPKKVRRSAKPARKPPSPPK